MKKNIVIKVIGLLIALSALGCSGSEHEGRWSKADDVNASDLRIISAAPSNTDIVVGLGLGDNLIAVDRHSLNIPGIPQNLPVIDFFYPDTEAVIGLAPDIILVNEVNTFGVADNPFAMLGELGIKVVPIKMSATVEDIYADILFIANELEVTERGEAMITDMKAEIGRITPAEEENRPTVYFEVAPAPAMISLGEGTYIHEMIELAGGRNIFADQHGWFSPGAEEIIGRNPDIIFTFSYPGEDPVPEIKSRPAFQNVSAVRENRVYGIDADSASRPSQNILKAFEQMVAAFQD